MNLEEAKAHMLGIGYDWSFYIKNMDSMARETMSVELKKLRREGWAVNTPFQYATAAQGDMLLNKVSGGSERSAGGDATPAASEPKKCKVCGEDVPKRNFNCCSDQCYREAYK